MAGLATSETNKSVEEFIDSISNASKRNDAKIVIEMIEKVSGYPPKIWGDNFIIGFGKRTYRRKNSSEDLEWFYVGFAPRKTKLTVYLNFDIEQEADLINRLGKCVHGRGCLHFNKLKDVDLNILEVLVKKCLLDN